MPSTAPAARTVRVEPVMGTVVSFDVRDDAPGIDDALAHAVAVLHAIDETFSTYRPSSAISRLERGDLALTDAPADVRWVLVRCAQLRQETGGYFDVRATGRLDPSALVKGWALERATRVLEAAGLGNFCITGGGDVVCRGAAAPGDRWHIGVQHPLDREAIAAVVVGTDLAVATSGAYERGDHVRDPYGGAAPRGVRSVTVTGPDLGFADAYSTAAFAMGAQGPAWTAHLPARGYEAMTILAAGTVRSTPGFPAQETIR